MVSSSEIPTGTSLDWEISGSEIAEDDGEGDTGESKFTIPQDTEDDENSAIKGVELSTATKYSKLGSKDQALSWKLKPEPFSGWLEKGKAPSASGSPRSKQESADKGQNMSWSGCTGYRCGSASVCA